MHRTSDTSIIPSACFNLSFTSSNSDLARFACSMLSLATAWLLSSSPLTMSNCCFHSKFGIIKKLIQQLFSSLGFRKFFTHLEPLSFELSILYFLGWHGRQSLTSQIYRLDTSLARLKFLVTAFSNLIALHPSLE